MDTLRTEAFFLKLYAELADPLFRHCYFRTGSRDVAEDLVQETFLRTWDYLAKGNRIESPKAFLYRTAGNLIIDHYREKKTKSLDALAEVGFDPAGDDAESVTAKAVGGEAQAMLARLEEPYRGTMLLRYVDGLSVTEIAELIGESQNVVSVRLHRGADKLRKLFHV